MKCANNANRECNEECAAFRSGEEVRDCEYVWDTCVNEYIPKYTRILMGNFCKRLGYLVGKTTVIAEGEKKK